MEKPQGVTVIRFGIITVAVPPPARPFSIGDHYG